MEILGEFYNFARSIKRGQIIFCLFSILGIFNHMVVDCRHHETDNVQHQSSATKHNSQLTSSDHLVDDGKLT